jgi:mannose-6-phosphate isomerase-like protein (cupin superfamily)
MRKIRKKDIINSIKNPLGEEIYELIGSSTETGDTTHHSLVYVVIPPGKSSQAHRHKVSEETYYILKGVGSMTINAKKFRLHPGYACLIHPGETHQIFNKGKGDLEFLTVSAPAWTPDDSFPPPEEKFER